MITFQPHAGKAVQVPDLLRRFADLLDDKDKQDLIRIQDFGQDRLGRIVKALIQYGRWIGVDLLERK